MPLLLLLLTELSRNPGAAETEVLLLLLPPEGLGLDDDFEPDRPRVTTAVGLVTDPEPSATNEEPLGDFSRRGLCSLFLLLLLLPTTPPPSKLKAVV